MELTIAQSCPSCGAEITLEEDDRLLTCSYCTNSNFRVSGTAGRYMLPSRAVSENRIEAEQLYFVPYLRFKGAVYWASSDQQLHSKLVDTTRIAVGSQTLPLSLGLRPQALSLYPVTHGAAGRYIPQTVETRAAFFHASSVLNIFQAHKNTELFHRAFIGETISRIYQPCYFHRDLFYDGVTNRPLGRAADYAWITERTIQPKESWEPQFLATTCPHCGGRLAGGKDTLVVRCDNCTRSWREENGRFVELMTQTVLSAVPTSQFLPFWKIRFTTRGSKALESYADFLSFTNQPLLRRNGSGENAPLIFFIPAFKLQPRLFLQLAARISLSQHQFALRQTVEVSGLSAMRMSVTTLAPEEAVQAVKTVLADTILPKEKLWPLLPSLEIIAHGLELCYLPFLQQGRDLVQEQCQASVPVAALGIGRGW